MKHQRCQCGRFEYCIPQKCLLGLKIKKRGSSDRRLGRFGKLQDDLHQSNSTIQTQVNQLTAKSIISTNQSPDIPWSKTLNPYIGCEHGCVYCYARPTHAYYDLSPGLDFETKLFAKTNAADILRETLSHRRYVPTTIGLGTNTDCYQPIERRYQITRSVLSVLNDFRHPVSVLTKNSLIERDIDILQQLSAHNLVEVHFTITTLNNQLAKRLEPRASLPKERLATIEKLAAAGIPVQAMMSPVIPGLNDTEMETIMTAAKQAGATSMGYILLRLPYEVEGLFSDWLDANYPDKKAMILDTMASYRPEDSALDYFETRMNGSGDAAIKLETHFLHLFNQLNFTPLSSDDLDHTLFTRRFGAIQQELF